MMQLIKGDSLMDQQGKINEQRKSNWQTGYGAFSYARSQIAVGRAIYRKPTEHHRK